MLAPMADFVRFDAANRDGQSVWVNPDNVSFVQHMAKETGKTLITSTDGSVVVDGEPKDIVRDLRDTRGEDA